MLFKPLVALQSVEDAFKEGKPDREWILQQLVGLVSYAKTKIADSNTSKEERIKWARVLVAAAMAASNTLRDQEIDELKIEIKQLKELVRIE
jgi:hypothetical protein